MAETSVPKRKGNSGRGLKIGLAVPIIVYALALVGFIENSTGFFGFPLDDAWIHRVYSRSFAYGHGLAYNDGRQEAGATSPLWVIVSAPAHWLGGLGAKAPVVAVKIIGILLGLAAVLACRRLALRLTGSALAATVAASIFAVDPRLLLSSLSGMETCLLIALVAWACIAIVERRPILFLVCLGLIPVTRPEGIIAMPLFLLGAWGLAKARWPWWKALAVSLITFVPLLAWVAFCLHANGHPLPNTFYLKAGHVRLEAQLAGVAFKAITRYGFASLWAFPVGIAAFLGLYAAAERRAWALASLVLIVLPLVYVAGVVGTRKIMVEGYYWMRWVDPAALLLNLPFAVGYGVVASVLAPGRLSLVRERFDRKWHVILTGVACACLVVLVISLPAFRKSFLERRHLLASDCRIIDALNVEAGKWIAANTPPDAVVGVNDGGAIRYFGDRKTIDLIGLNDADIAFRRLTMRDAIMSSDWLVVFPTWFLVRGQMPTILGAFETRTSFQVPQETYTIAPTTGQNVIIVYQRKGTASQGPRR